MTTLIPAYPLQSVSRRVDHAAEVFFLDEHTPTGGPPYHVPSRGNYYKIGLRPRGELALKVNLATYTIGPNCRLLITPHVLKEWTSFSADHASLSVFFTREFITRHITVHTGTCHCLENVTRHVLPLLPAGGVGRGRSRGISSSGRFGGAWGRGWRCRRPAAGRRRAGRQ